MKNPMRVLTILAALTLLGTAPAAAHAVRITYIQGQVEQGASETGPWQPIERSATVAPGSFLRTADDGIVELTLADGSVLRLGPGSLYGIQQADFSERRPRRFSAKLLFGKLWAKIRKRSGRLQGRFETQIPTAVVGVRGTVYNLAAARDQSAEIQVYEGRVGVAPPVLAPGAARQEVAWPTRVSERQWEEIILGKLQRLRIGADGRPGQAESFDPQAVKDAWVEFNQRRDAGS